MITGIVLIIFGTLLLLQNLGIVSSGIWGMFWPVLIISIGIKFLTKKKYHNHYSCCDSDKKEKGNKEPSQS